MTDTCTWCGHDPHPAGPCPRTIQTRTNRKDPTETTVPCPCTREARTP